MARLALAFLSLLLPAAAFFFSPSGCAKGHYGTPGSCVPCAPGTANPSTGATSASACVPCAPGYYASKAGAAECRSCGAYATSFQSGATTCECDQVKAPGYTQFRDIHVGLAECCSDATATCASACGLARIDHP